MVRSLGTRGILGIVLLVAGVGLIASHSLVVAGGIALVVAGAVLVVLALLGRMLESLRMF